MTLVFQLVQTKKLVSSEVAIAVIVSCVFTSYFCVMESQEISSLLLSQLGQGIIIFTSEGLKQGGISLLPLIRIIFFLMKKKFQFMTKKKHIFQKKLSNVHSRRRTFNSSLILFSELTAFLPVKNMGHSS